jgi:hypothetical protein
MGRLLTLGQGAAVIIGMAFITACGTPLQYVKQTPGTYTPRGDPSTVKVLFADPGEPYEVLGFINWDYYQPGWRAPSITDILPRLQQKAWEGVETR